MQRKYTDEVYNDLKKQIKQIGEEQFSGITDAVGDLWYMFSSWIGFLDIENHIDDVAAYHKKVLDQHDTKLEDLKQIFKAVENVDDAYNDKLMEINTALIDYNEAIKSLKNVIDPICSNFNVNSIKAIDKRLSDSLQEAQTKISLLTKEMIADQEKNVVLNAGKELIFDLLSLAGDVVGFCANLLSGKYVKAATDVYGILDNFFKFAEDFSAIAIVPVGWGLSLFFKDKNAARLYILETASELQKGEGLEWEFEEAWGKESAVAKGAKGLETIVDTVELAYDASNFVSSVGNAETILKNEHLTSRTKIEILINEFGCGGFSNTDYGEDTALGRFKNQKGLISNVKRLAEIADCITSGDKEKLFEVVAETTNLPNFAHDTNDVINDILDTFFVN